MLITVLRRSGSIPGSTRHTSPTSYWLDRDLQDAIDRSAHCTDGSHKMSPTHGCARPDGHTLRIRMYPPRAM